MGKIDHTGLLFGLAGMFGNIPRYPKQPPAKASRTKEDITERKDKQAAKLARRAARR